MFKSNVYCFFNRKMVEAINFMTMPMTCTGWCYSSIYLPRRGSVSTSLLIDLRSKTSPTMGYIFLSSLALFAFAISGIAEAAAMKSPVASTEIPLEPRMKTPLKIGEDFLLRQILGDLGKKIAKLGCNIWSKFGHHCTQKHRDLRLWPLLNWNSETQYKLATIRTPFLGQLKQIVPVTWNKIVYKERQPAHWLPLFVALEWPMLFLPLVWS